MSHVSDQASDQARFAAREFVARWVRETGEVLSDVMTDRMLFAYEMGYLRGRSTAQIDAMEMFEDLSRAREATKEDSDDDDTK